MERIISCDNSNRNNTEETCEFNASEYGNGICSACGFEAGEYECWDWMVLKFTENYCPHCGRKVMNSLVF